MAFGGVRNVTHIRQELPFVPAGAVELMALLFNILELAHFWMASTDCGAKPFAATPRDGCSCDDFTLFQL
jgi:hypothetical protein